MSILLEKKKKKKKKYENELAVDAGGVSQDVYGTVWDKVYEKFFLGVSSVISAVNPGRILSHGYLAIGFFYLSVIYVSMYNTFG